MTCSFTAGAQVTFTGIATADAFLATGSPGNPEGADLTGSNFGAAGVLVIASPASVKGEFQSIVKFNLPNAPGVFNSAYGSNGWNISAISIDLACNTGTNGAQPNNAMFDKVRGGKFVVEWLSANDWLEGTGMPNQPTTDGVTYSSLPTLLSSPHEILGTNTYTPPGNNVHVIYPLPLNTNMVAEASAGGLVSLHFYAADTNINYLFNSYSFGHGNEPRINITASPSLRFTSAGFTNGNFHLQASGGSGIQYQVQASADLSTTNWQSIGTVTADAAGAITFDDTNAPGHARQFYRLTQ